MFYKNCYYKPLKSYAFLFTCIVLLSCGLPTFLHIYDGDYDGRLSVQLNITI